MSFLQVKVSERKTDTGVTYEGTVSIPGLRPTKLARKSDGVIQFSSRSALTAAARTLARSLGFEDIAVAATGAAVVRKAAAKRVVAPTTNT